MAELVHDLASLERFFAALPGAAWIALATEANAMHAYRPRVCLVQVGIGRPDGVTVFALDALAFGTARPHPLAALTDHLPATAPVLVHGGEYTMAALKRDLRVGFAARPVIDTQQAAVLLGLPETGYRSLCKAFLGEALPAPLSVDWAERPLQGAHVEHALEDVRHLGRLWSALEARIAAADLYDELREASLLVADTPPRANLPDPDRFHQLPGASGLPPAGMALLQALVAWRDRKARELDLPPGKLFPNAQLVTLARRPDRAADEIERMRFHSRLVWSDREAVRRIVVLALAEGEGAAPDAPAPSPAPASIPVAAPVAARPRRPSRAAGPPSPLVKARIERLKRWRRDEAERRGVGLQAVLPGAVLEHLAWFGVASAAALAAVPGLGARRVERYAAVLLELCASSDGP